MMMMMMVIQVLIILIFPSVCRYHPHLLLAKSRFLFPLTSKRICLIKELLRISETDSLHPCNVAKIDRRVPLKERHKYPPSNTVFMQMFNALKNKELDFRFVQNELFALPINYRDFPL